MKTTGDNNRQTESEGINLMNKSRDTTPLVSVVVPIYNAEEYINECIESILSQEYWNIELILVDDGSPDASGVIADRIGEADSRVKVLHKQNGGVSSARNAGCAASSGDIVIFVDADDMLEPSAINRIASAMEEADIVVYGWNEYTSDGRFVRKVVPPLTETTDSVNHINNIINYNIREFVFSYAFRAEALSRCDAKNRLFVEDCGLFEDALSIHIFLRSGNYRIIYLQEALYGYRENQNSATHRHNPKLAKEGLGAIQSLSSMSVSNGYEEKWHAKLLLMALSGADWAAGPGCGDGQRRLHKEIGQEVRRQATAGGFRGLDLSGKIKFGLSCVGLYRWLRRARLHFTKHARSK